MTAAAAGLVDVRTVNVPFDFDQPPVSLEGGTVAVTLELGTVLQFQLDTSAADPLNAFYLMKSGGYTPKLTLKTTANADLLTDRTFSSFELTLEWKIQAKGNSGIFFWATEDTKVVYMNAPEIQVLDNGGHPDGKSPLTSAGALYGLFPADSTFPKPVGEWNQVRVVAKGSVIETWFNGHKIARADFDSPELIAQTPSPVRIGAAGARHASVMSQPATRPTRNGHAVMPRPTSQSSPWLARPMTANATTSITSSAKEPATRRHAGCGIRSSRITTPARTSEDAGRA